MVRLPRREPTAEEVLIQVQAMEPRVSMNSGRTHEKSTKNPMKSTEIH